MAKINKSKKAKAAAACSRGGVGPDYVRVLSGTLASKSISLILCGESHRDAIDVTRANGGKVDEGWAETNVVELTSEMVGKMGKGRDSDDIGVRIKCGMYKRYSKSLPLCKVMDWGSEMMGKDVIMDYILHRTGS